MAGRSSKRSMLSGLRLSFLPKRHARSGDRGRLQTVFFIARSRSPGYFRSSMRTNLTLVMASAPLFWIAARVQAASVTIPNFSFETGNLPPANSPITPNGTDAEQFDGMMTETPDSPSGWQFLFEANPAATANGLWGTQIPRANGTANNNFYGSKPGFNGVTSLPATFDGIQFACINLNNDPSSAGGSTIARADSGPIATLEAGTYTLTVAVGARSTTAWRNIDYSIGLVGATSG